MRYMKKIIGFVLVLYMVVGLAGCGKTESKLATQEMTAKEVSSIASSVVIEWPSYVSAEDLSYLCRIYVTDKSELDAMYSSAIQCMNHLGFLESMQEFELNMASGCEIYLADGQQRVTITKYPYESQPCEVTISVKEYRDAYQSDWAVVPSK